MSSVYQCDAASLVRTLSDNMQPDGSSAYRTDDGSNRFQLMKICCTLVGLEEAEMSRRRVDGREPRFFRIR